MIVVSRACLGTLLLIAAAAANAADQEVTLDAKQLGRAYEGIGTLSAGASSKLLIDYPEPQRAQILDLVFKPKYGASLQHLKVEIGGDVNSTCGTEPAFAHTREEFLNPKPSYLKRGYEWWLMREARKRAPAIQLDALQWGAPGWIGGGQFYSQDNADFVTAFHSRCRKELGIATQYQGIWNETPYQTEYIKTLRRTLDRSGLQEVKIVASDQAEARLKWKTAEDAANDAELSSAIYAFGDHYVAYQSSKTARDSGKPLWANEDGPWAGDWYGATKLAKLLNRTYIDGRMTRIITWSLITSYYDILPLPGSGLMRANEPWSGHYEIQPAIWAVAHTTQFADPGWRYIDSGCGYLKGNGSLVTLRSPDGDDYSIVVETMDSPYVVTTNQPQEVTFRLGEGIPEKPLIIWRSNASEQFTKLGTVQPKDRMFRYSFDGESIYTLTTTTGQRKGGADLTIPVVKGIPLPYVEDFEKTPEHTLPKYFIDQSGVFEVEARPDAKGACLRQAVPAKGIEWHYHGNPEPYTLMGQEAWRDYEVSVEADLDSSGYAAVYGRISKVDTTANPPDGYSLKLSQDGTWALDRKNERLQSGRCQLERATWHRLGLRFLGDTIVALVEGTEVGRAKDSAYRSGLAGLGCSWRAGRFDNFRVSPVSP